MSRPQKLCAYCSKPGTTKEHYWGKWSRKYLPHVNRYTQHTVSRISGMASPDHPIVMVGQGSQNRPGDLRAQTLKIVCTACNTRWMKAVNEAAEPHLVRLAEGEWWALTPTEKTQVAAWATMFSMTYEFADRFTLASTQAERDYLRENREPPPNWTIWIGSYGEGDWTHQCNHHAARAELNPSATVISEEPDVRISPNMNCQITVFTFGHLLIVTFSHRIRSPVRADAFGAVFGLQTIWPTGFGAVGKPIRHHTDSEIEAIAFGLSRNFMPGIGPPPHPDTIPRGWEPVE